MEYKKSFIIRGEYGMHTGPAEHIANKVMVNALKLFPEYELEIKIKKGNEIANADAVLEILSLGLFEGTELEIIATLIPNDLKKKDKIIRLVEDIGKIIENTDRYTLRSH